MSLTTLLIPTFTQMLSGLSAWLDKAATCEQAAERDPDELLSLRITPDMYPLASQVRFACVQAQESVYRLRGEPIVQALNDLRQEGWDAGTHPGSLADAQIRLADTIAMLGQLAPDALDAGAERAIVLALPNGVIFDMTGEQYARDWALPQFYFHLNTAYAILRSRGVELGKADYVSHMLGYMRPE